MNTFETSQAETMIEASELLKILIPNGSMRDSMIAYLRSLGFVPEDEDLLQRVQDLGKYAEGTLGFWIRGTERIEIQIRDRRNIPYLVKEAEKRSEILIALTCSDIVLNNWLTLQEEGQNVGECPDEIFRSYPIPVASGRSGGNARWALLTKKDDALAPVPECGEGLIIYSELPLLAGALIKNFTEDFAAKIKSIVQIDGGEEKAVVDALQQGINAGAICVVETGRSAAEKGLKIIELMRVEAKLILSELLAMQNPELGASIEALFNLSPMRDVLWPDFQKRGGFITVILQDVNTDQVLMVGSANEAAFRRTLETGKATLYSTSRRELWIKGETSGNEFQVLNILLDCDGDAVIYRVKAVSPDTVACHTGMITCFFRQAVTAVMKGNEHVLDTKKVATEILPYIPSTKEQT